MTSQPIVTASITAVPEFVDAKGLRSIFGICRSTGYALADAGLVKTVCLRRPGAIKGKRLWCAQSLRDYLRANIDQRKKGPVCLPSAQSSPGSDSGANLGTKQQAAPSSGDVESQIQAIRVENERMSKQLAAIKQQQRH
jgi:hypothetical protein